MKKALFILLFLSSLFGEHIKWQGDYNKALQKAKWSHKPFIVLLIENNCSKCKDIIRDVFTNQPYIQRLNSSFVAVIVNRDYRYSYPIELYYSTKFPTLFFVDSQNEMFLVEPIYGNNISVKKIEKVLNEVRLKIGGHG